MSIEIRKYIAHKIQERKDADAFRQFRINEGAIDFCSNDYLGFARSEELFQEVEKEAKMLEQRLNGSTGARTITGSSALLEEVEQKIAAFHLSEAALFYNSGYTANLGLFSALPYRGDTILYDALIHASIRDGIRLSKANSFSFEHNNLESLEKRLAKANGNVFVAVESIYSMDGDAAPLKDLAALCNKYQAALIVDEAHSNGIYGKEGEGMVVELGLESDVFARVVTFGKALGCHGAAVLGSKDLKNFLINYSRPFIYTTAPAPHQVLGVKIAYDNLSKVSDKRLYLSKLIDLFNAKLDSLLRENLIGSSSPIQCIIVPGNAQVKRLCAMVLEDGIDLRPIVAPTVPLGKERIRICLHAFNTEEDLERLTTSLNRNYKKLLEGKL
ncbi:MAG: 8-amino-7-oxononanoate synthase [Chitinophagales bacterium]|nr:8-amino-7-oxononanoate synthase [Chitinophagales bacterium]